MRPHLLPFERAWTDAAFDAIYPEGTPLGPGVRSMHPARFFDDLLHDVPLEQSVGLRLALWIVALAPLFTVAKLGTIASIAPVDRARVLERLLASPSYVVRQLALSLKAMATLLYARSDDVRIAMTTPRHLVTLRTGMRPARGARDAEGAHHDRPDHADHAPHAAAE